MRLPFEMGRLYAPCGSLSSPQITLANYFRICYKVRMRPDGAELLKRYLARLQLDQREFAREAKIDEAALSRYLRRRQIPALRDCAAIHAATDGRITMHDWLRVEVMP